MAINLQTLLEGFTGGLRGFNQANLLRGQREQEGLDQALVLAREERAQRGDIRAEAKFKESQVTRQQELARRTRTGESALMKAIFESEEQGIQDRSLQLLLTGQGVSERQAQDFVRAGGRTPSAGQIFQKPEKPPKPVLTGSQTGVRVSEQLKVQKQDILNKAQELSGFQIKNLSDLQGAAREVPELNKLLQEFQFIGGATSRAITRDSLQGLRPDIFGGGPTSTRTIIGLPPGRSQQRTPRNGPIDIKSLSDEDVEKLARGESL